MKGNEKFWKIAEIVLGAIGAALLVAILVLKIVGKEILWMTYPLVGVVVLFLICDEIARSIRRKREKEETDREKAEHPEEPETQLPKEAFEFEEKPEEKQP